LRKDDRNFIAKKMRRASKQSNRARIDGNLIGMGREGRVAAIPARIDLSGLSGAPLHEFVPETASVAAL
jgi:hypothetical protein